MPRNIILARAVLLATIVPLIALASAGSNPPSFPSFQTESKLLRTVNDPRVYEIQNGLRHWIPSPQVFKALGFSWRNVQLVSNSQLSQYRRASLLRPAASDKIYYLTEAGFIRHIPNPAVFLSYSNRWQDVIQISQLEFSAYPKNTLVRLYNDPRVWLLEQAENNQTVKRWIKTASVFNRLGLNWQEIAPINEVEFAAYPEGAVIE